MQGVVDYMGYLREKFYKMNFEHKYIFMAVFYLQGNQKHHTLYLLLIIQEFTTMYLNVLD